MKIFSFVLFVLMVVAQWFVPLSMVVEAESLRENGTLFRFETEPVDPTDPFRGKYITLNFVQASFTVDSAWYDLEVDVFVTVENDSAGMAKVMAVSLTKPSNTEHYFKAKAVSRYSNTLIIHFPFERFYLEESKAEAAETIYRDNNRDEKHSRAYAEVYIKNGASYLHDVKIEGESVVDIVKRVNAMGDAQSK